MTAGIWEVQPFGRTRRERRGGKGGRKEGSRGGGAKRGKGEDEWSVTRAGEGNRGGDRTPPHPRWGTWEGTCPNLLSFRGDSPSVTRRAGPQGDQCLLRWPNLKPSASPLVFLHGEGPGAVYCIGLGAQKPGGARCHVDRLIRQARRGPGEAERSPSSPPPPDKWFNPLWDKLLRSRPGRRRRPPMQTSRGARVRTYTGWYGHLTRMNGRPAKDGGTA